jgi:hypothetical protein
MAQLMVPTSEPNAEEGVGAVLWRIGGALGLAHVLMMFGGMALEVVVDPATDPDALHRAYADAPLTRVLLAGYVEALAFVVLAVAIVVMARLFARRNELSQLATASFVALGIAYVAATFAVGFPPGAAALHGAHRGADAQGVAMVNDIRNYGYLLQVALQSALTAALGVAAVASRTFVRWGRAGVVVGAIGLLATPIAHNVVGLVLLAWWVGIAVLCLRAPGPASTTR